MRDLLPDYVHGTLSAAKRSIVDAHLQTCAECAAEVDLIAAASRAFPAPAIDVARIVKALPSAPRVTRGGSAGIRAWRYAAALGIVAIGAFAVLAVRGAFRAPPPQVAATQGQGQGQGPAGGEPIAIAARTPVAAETPRRSTSSAVAPQPGRSSISFGGGLSDLSDDQLDTLLGELDSLDALPSAEPESQTSPIVPPADGGHSAR